MIHSSLKNGIFRKGMKPEDTRFIIAAVYYIRDG